MKLILLVGKPNTGKTTTLNLLYDKLCPKQDSSNIVEAKKQLGANKKDFECVVTWSGQVGSIKVGIFTMGDYYRECIRAAQRYSQKVDVLVLAYSDNFKSGPQKIVAPYPAHFIVNKTLASATLPQEQANTLDVNTIIAAL